MGRAGSCQGPLSLQEVQLCHRRALTPARPGPGLVKAPRPAARGRPRALSLGGRSCRTGPPVFARLTWATDVLLWGVWSRRSRTRPALPSHKMSLSKPPASPSQHASHVCAVAGPPGRLGIGSLGSSEHEYYRDVEPKAQEAPGAKHRPGCH